MFGWTGTILRVDLTKGKVTREATDIKMAHDYIGARGLGGKIITDEIDPKIDASEPGQQAHLRPRPPHGHVRAVGRAATKWSPRARSTT